MGNIVQRAVCLGRRGAAAQPADGHCPVGGQNGHSPRSTACGPQYGQRAPGFVHGPRIGNHPQLFAGLQRFGDTVHDDHYRGTASELHSVRCAVEWFKTDGNVGLHGRAASRHLHGFTVVRDTKWVEPGDGDCYVDNDSKNSRDAAALAKIRTADAVVGDAGNVVHSDCNRFDRGQLWACSSTEGRPCYASRAPHCFTLRVLLRLHQQPTGFRFCDAIYAGA